MVSRILSILVYSKFNSRLLGLLKHGKISVPFSISLSTTHALPAEALRLHACAVKMIFELSQQVHFFACASKEKGLTKTTVTILSERRKYSLQNGRLTFGLVSANGSVGGQKAPSINAPRKAAHISCCLRFQPLNPV